MNNNPNDTETAKAHGKNWRKWLNHLSGRPDVKGLEIGTFEGESATWMCFNIFSHPLAEYICVDPFTGNEEHKIGGVDCSRLEERATAALLPFPQCRIIKALSGETLPGLDHEFDFVYVDGAHDAMNVLRDSVMAFEILKPGGILVWDDYEWTVMPNANDRPKPAIDAFLGIYAGHIQVLEPKGWQVACKKL